MQSLEDVQAAPAAQETGRDRTRLVALLSTLLVLVVGIVYSNQLENEQRFLDERDYHRLGYYVVAEGRYTLDGERPTAYRAPGYPLFLAFVRVLGGGGVEIRLGNFLALCATILLGYRFLARRGMPRAGALAAVLCALYPPFLYTASTLYPQTIGALVLACLMNALPVERRLRPGRGALLGLISGVLALTIPTFLAGIVLVFGWLLLRGRRAALPGVLTGGLVLCSMVGVWTVRNYVAFDAFVPLTTNAGRNLLLGNSENTRPASGVNVDLSEYEVVADRLDEVHRDRYLRDAALTWIRENPGAWLRLYALKVLNHFNVWNVYATDDEIGLLESIVLAVFFLPLLAVFVWRLSRLRREPFFPDEGALVLVYLGMALATALFFTRIRFRLPLDHLLIWVVAAWILGRAERRGTEPRAAMADGPAR